MGKKKRVSFFCFPPKQKKQAVCLSFFFEGRKPKKKQGQNTEEKKRAPSQSEMKTRKLLRIWGQETRLMINNVLFTQVKKTKINFCF